MFSANNSRRYAEYRRQLRRKRSGEEPAKPEPAERARKPEPSAKGDDREKKEKKGD